MAESGKTEISDLGGKAIGPELIEGAFSNARRILYETQKAMNSQYGHSMLASATEMEANAKLEKFLDDLKLPRAVIIRILMVSCAIEMSELISAVVIDKKVPIEYLKGERNNNA